MRKVYNSIDKMIGKTPMFEFENLKNKLALKANIFGKCEFYNPLFSIKDRVVCNMIAAANKCKNFDAETILVAATRGNFGMSVAAIGAAKGIKVLLIMPEDAPKEKIRLAKYFGADVILTPAEDGIKGAEAKAKMLAEKSDKVVWLRQFDDEANVNTHLFYTSTEIMDDLAGEVDVLVAGIGTGATLTGVAKALRSSNPELYVVAVKAKKADNTTAKANMRQYIPGMEDESTAGFYKAELINEVFEAESNDAWDMAKALAQTEGLPVGVSGGAAMLAAVDLAARENFAGKNIVVILPDAINGYYMEEM